MEGAHQSDVHAVGPYLEAAASRNVLPAQLLADTLYGCDDNCTKAEAQGVELVAPVTVPGTTGEISLADFALAESGKVAACPANLEPVQVKYKKNRFSAKFRHDQCADCELKPSCPSPRWATWPLSSL